jgi:hypothetical protein
MLPEMIVDALHSTIAQGIEPEFASYIQQHRTRRWLMFSDYVLKHPGRPNDVFAFTLVPGGTHLESVTAALTSGAIRDFKDVRKISKPMLSLLTDRRLYTFCFIVKPSRVITRNVTTLRRMLDNTIAMMEQWKDAGSHVEIIKQFKAMRRKADAQSFNVRLVDNIILATTLASFLTYIICKYVRAERIGWFSDRDSITTAHQSIASHFYSVNVSACCQRLMHDWPGPELGLNGAVEEGRSLWCDAHLRVPDYFAGTISAWNIEQHSLVSEAPKYTQVLMEAVADQRNVHIMRLTFDWKNDRLGVSASRVMVSHK